MSIEMMYSVLNFKASMRRPSKTEELCLSREGGYGNRVPGKVNKVFECTSKKYFSVRATGDLFH